MPNLKRYREDTHNPHIHIPGYKAMEAIGRQGLNGLYKLSYKGLSIIYITAFPRPIAKVDKSTNLQIHNWRYSPMHEREGLSSLSQYVRRLQTTVYKRYTHIPIDIQTISSGIWAYIRFGYKGLKVIWFDKRFDGFFIFNA